MYTLTRGQLKQFTVELNCCVVQCIMEASVLCCAVKLLSELYFPQLSS